MNAFRSVGLVIALGLFISAGTVLAADGVTTLTAPDGTTVVIYRDNYGVPHIRANNESAVFFGHGYAAAEDRLFQMEVFRRAALGRLSEAGMGSPNTDIQVRSVFYTSAERAAQLDATPPHIRTMFESYAAGVNAYLALVATDPAALLPVQFHVLGFSPAPWTPTDVVAVAQFFMRRFGQYGGQELQRLAELQANGPAWFEANRPLNDPLAPTTVHASAAKSTASGRLATPAEARKTSLSIPARVDPTVAASLQRDREAAEAELQRLGVGGLGSFAVLINTEKSASGNVLLLGAPQLGAPTLTDPNITHEVELDAPSLKVSGMGIAGIPGVVIGRNEHIAWTLTSGNSDNTDTFVEILHPTDLQYFHNGAYHDFEIIPEPDLSFNRLRTIHGPVIGLDAMNRMAFSWMMTFWDQELAMVESFYEVWKAQDRAGFETVMRHVPMNFHVFYAGRDQQVAYWHVGRLLRSNQTLTGPDPRLPRLGDGSQEWGTDPFLTLEELPTTNGDLQDYIVNWNNKPAPDWNHGDNVIWSTVFQPERTLRVLRIEDYVAPLTPFAFEDLKGVPLAAEDLGTYQQIIEFGGDVLEDRSENIVAPGQSGFIGLAGPDPHFADQWSLHLLNEFKDMVYNTPVSLWPPNGAMQPVDVTPFLDAALPEDACIAEVWADEAAGNGGRGSGIGVTLEDATTVLLRAEREADANGRVYTIHVAAPDPAGKPGTAALFQAVVPRDQGDGSQALDDGPAYSVVGPCAPGAPVAARAAAPQQSLSNHPNPFNPTTSIHYVLTEASHVELGIYDVLGRRVALLVDAEQEAAEHVVEFDAGTLPTGVYFARMRTEQGVQTRALVFAK